MKRQLLALLAIGIAALAWSLWPGTVGLPPGVEAEAARTTESEAAMRFTGDRDPKTELSQREEIPSDPRPYDPDDLVVRVVDERGRPSPGVPLAITPHAQLHDDSLPRLFFAKTDATGHAVFPLQRKALRNAWRLAYLVHDVLFAKQPAVELSPVALARPVIETVQPPYGAIEVQVSQPEGTAAERLHKAGLALIEPGETEDPTLAWRRKHWSREVPDGANHVRFDFVELGREWMATAVRKGAETPARARGRGPSLQGEVRRIEVKMGVGQPVAVFRAVDERGTPLPGWKLDVTLHRDWGGRSTQNVTTGGDGRFEIDATSSSIFGQHIHVRRSDTTGNPLGALVGSAKLPSRLKNGRNDCGDVVLRPPGPLVTGRVVDEAGNPVPKIRVRAGTNVNYRGASRTFFLFGDEGVDGHTDESGAFTLVGEIPQEVFHVYVDGKNRRSDPVAAKRGDRDKLLICYDVHVPSVDIRLSKGGSWDGVAIRLRDSGAKGDGVGTTSASQEGDTVHADLAPVRSGLYDLSWTFQGKPLGRRDNIRIDESGTIATIDLRGALFEHVVHFEQGPNRRDDIRGTVFWQPVGGSDDWEPHDFSASPVRFRSTARAVNLRVYPNGHREEFRYNVTIPQTIRLREGLRVRLVLRTAGELPEHPYIFDPAPQVQGKWVGQPVGSRYFTKTKREAVFLLPAGRIDVGWHLERRSETGAVGGGVLGRHKVAIEVRESTVEQVFYLDLDGTALERLIANPPW